GNNVNERRVAYVQYVSSKEELCNSVMILAELHRLGAVADKMLVYPHSWIADEKGRWNRLLKVAEQRYGVIVKAVEPLIEGMLRAPSETTPAVSLLHAFSQKEYNRILYLDSRGMVLRNLDELFFNAPSAPIGGVRSYNKIAGNTLSDHLLLIEPSEHALGVVKSTLTKNPSAAPIDVINTLYAPYALILPQHPYNTIISEFRAAEHERYMPDSWSPSEVREESYYVNFEDDEAPGPWYAMPQSLVDKIKPKRKEEDSVWRELYETWARRRMDVCGLDLEPLPLGTF
ncbi:hypothetical protein DFP73DRAFT_478818, partial [Morchella snyderi]